MSYEVRFMDGPLRHKKYLVEDYRQPVYAAMKEKFFHSPFLQDIDIIPMPPKQVMYLCSSVVTRQFVDGSPTQVYYEMRVKK